MLLPAGAGAVRGGQVADRADYPFFAVVGSGCGGALISPDRVLTAAHCTEALFDSDVVLIGPRDERRRIRRRAMEPLHWRELQKVAREFPPPAADLMVLQLDRPVTDVSPVKIARRSDALARPGTPVVMIGRGASAMSGEGLGVFRSARVDVVASTSCREQLGSGLLRRWSVCTRGRPVPGPGGITVFTSACVGDSGSPLLAGPRSRRRIVAVDSWGPACGEQGDPEIYANAVAGRRFALAKRVVWAPEAIGRAAIAGEPRAGQAVACRARWLVKPTRKFSYDFTLDGFVKQSGPSPRFRLPTDAAGKRVSCSAGGETAGGRGGTPGLAPARTVQPARRQRRPQP